ncbi:anti-sigma factor family protein [Sphingomonas elodea]|uniref:anti-sigma factor family protein n=1 Tax=Sphingomonas elodea TaxID=179878 RepID=UPI0002630A96|nr:zf-HC2 domain-containing protein [Sphingomonas elodea]
MGDLHHLRGDPHEATQQLLPWYVTGAIEPGDRLLVETHLPQCEACRAELAAERRLRLAVADLPAAAPGGWERLVADLAEPAPPQRLPRRFVVNAGWMLGAQAALLLLGIGVVLQFRQPAVPSAGAYHALGAPEARPAGNILVMFAPDTREAALRQTIAASNARLVDGPTAAGAYLLAIAPEQRRAAIARLRAAPGVVMVQPIDPAP